MPVRRLYPEIRVALTDPNGVEMDLSERIDRGGLGTIQEALEEDIAALEHSDISLTVQDFDGAVERFLEAAAPGDVYELVVERESQVRRPKWLRVFGGVLDFPESISYDRKDKTVTLQAFAWTKLLSLASAEPVARTFVGVLANTAASSAVVTLSGSGTTLARGDEIQIDTDSTSETGVVLRVDSATQVTCEETFDNTVTGGSCTLNTPYYRNKTVEFLVAALLDAAGITDSTITVGEQALADYPVGTELNTDGLPVIAPRSIVEKAGKIVVAFSPGGQKEAATTQSGFSTHDASTNGHIDWRPYLNAEPGTIVTVNAGDVSSISADHANGHYFSISDTIQTPPAHTQLNILKDGTPVDNIDDFVDTNEEGYEFSYQEWDPVNNDVWVSFQRFDDGVPRTSIYDVVGDSTSVLTTAYAGQLRYVKPLERMAMLDRSGNLHLWNTATQAITKTVTGIPITAVLWTLRVWGTFAAYLYLVGGATRCRIHDTDTWATLADFQVSSTNSGAYRFLTVFDTGADTDEDGLVGVAYAGGQYLVLSRRFEGVIPYADFEGKSCGAALRDLCIATASFLTMDEYKSATFKGRGEWEASEPVAEIANPIEQETQPLWERYRASVRVSGVDDAGQDIEVVAGDTGDSAHRAEISSVAITTESLAQTTASGYMAFLGRIRKQEIVAIPEGDTLIRPLDVVTFGAKNWLVLEAETDLEDREQDLTLVEV